MKNRVLFAICVLTLLLLINTQGIFAENICSNASFINCEENSRNLEKERYVSSLSSLSAKAHFVPVSITGFGDIYTTLFYVALIPILVFQFFYLIFELLGFYPNFPILNYFCNTFLPNSLERFADARDSYFPIFLSSPMIHINQRGGSYNIGGDEGRAFNGELFGFTGVAWEKMGGRISIKGFALSVDY